MTRAAATPRTLAPPSATLGERIASSSPRTRPLAFLSPGVVVVDVHPLDASNAPCTKRTRLVRTDPRRLPELATARERRRKSR